MAFATLFAAAMVAAGFLAGREILGVDQLVRYSLFDGLGTAIVIVLGGAFSVVLLALAYLVRKRARVSRYLIRVVVAGWVAVGAGTAMTLVGGPSGTWPGEVRISAPPGVSMDDRLQASCVSLPGKPDELELVSTQEFPYELDLQAPVAYWPNYTPDAGYYAEALWWRLDGGGMTGEAVFRVQRLYGPDVQGKAGWPEEFEINVRFDCRSSRP